MFAQPVELLLEQTHVPSSSRSSPEASSWSRSPGVTGPPLAQEGRGDPSRRKARGGLWLPGLHTPLRGIPHSPEFSFVKSTVATQLPIIKHEWAMIPPRHGDELPGHGRTREEP